MPCGPISMKGLGSLSRSMRADNMACARAASSLVRTPPSRSRTRAPDCVGQRIGRRSTMAKQQKHAMQKQPERFENTWKKEAESEGNRRDRSSVKMSAKGEVSDGEVTGRARNSIVGSQREIQGAGRRTTVSLCSSHRITIAESPDAATFRARWES